MECFYRHFTGILVVNDLVRCVDQFVVGLRLLPVYILCLAARTDRVGYMVGWAEAHACAPSGVGAPLLWLANGGIGGLGAVVLGRKSSWRGGPEALPAWRLI